MYKLCLVIPLAVLAVAWLIPTDPPRTRPSGNIEAQHDLSDAAQLFLQLRRQRSAASYQQIDTRMPLGAIVIKPDHDWLRKVVLTSLPPTPHYLELDDRMGSARRSLGAGNDDMEFFASDAIDLDPATGPSTHPVFISTGQAVPEPATLTLLGLGGAFVLRRRRRR